MILEEVIQGLSICAKQFLNWRIRSYISFSFLLPWQPEFCMEWKSLKGDHPWIIPVMYGEIPLNCLGDVV